MKRWGGKNIASWVPSFVLYSLRISIRPLILPKDWTLSQFFPFIVFTLNEIEFQKWWFYILSLVIVFWVFSVGTIQICYVSWFGTWKISVQTEESSSCCKSWSVYWCLKSSMEASRGVPFLKVRNINRMCCFSAKLGTPNSHWRLWNITLDHLRKVWKGGWVLRIICFLWS